jgi:hypothetical protein
MPGNSPGISAFGGDLHFGQFVNLQIELAGTQAGSGHDALDIAGAVTLDGTLHVSLLDNFMPTAGSTFEIIAATGGITGTFVDSILPELAGDLFWNLSYSADSVILEVAAPGLDGDFNLDGAVDAADYVMWRKLNNSPAAFQTWRENFGTTLNAGGGSEESASIPEPAALALFLWASLFPALRASRQRGRGLSEVTRQNSMNHALSRL